MSTFALHTHTHGRGEGKTQEEEGNTREGEEGWRRDRGMYVIVKASKMAEQARSTRPDELGPISRSNNFRTHSQGLSSVLSVYMCMRVHTRQVGLQRKTRKEFTMKIWDKEW